MALPKNMGGIPAAPPRSGDYLKLRESEFSHIVAILAQDVIGLAESTAAQLIRGAILRDYRTELKDGVYWLPMLRPAYGIRADRKLSVSFKVYFDMDDILKARTRKLRERSEGARHLILDAEKVEKKNGKK